MDEIKNREFVLGVLDEMNVKHVEKDEQIAFVFDRMDDEERTLLGCTVSFVEDFVLIKANATKSIMPSAKTRLLFFTNEINNSYFITMTGITSENMFYAMKAIDTGMGEMTAEFFKFALFDVMHVTRCCMDSVMAIESGEMSTEDAIRKTIKSLFKCAAGDDAADDSVHAASRNTNEMRHEDTLRVDLSRYLDFCEAVEEGEASRLNTMLSADVELLHLYDDEESAYGRDDVMEALFKEMGIASEAADLHIGRLLEGEKQQNGSTPFMKDEVCIFSGEHPEALVFLTVDEESNLINGVYFDKSAGYSPVLIV